MTSLSGRLPPIEAAPELRDYGVMALRSLSQRDRLCSSRPQHFSQNSGATVEKFPPLSPSEPLPALVEPFADAPAAGHARQRRSSRASNWTGGNVSGLLGSEGRCAGASAAPEGVKCLLLEGPKSVLFCAGWRDL